MRYSLRRLFLNTPTMALAALVRLGVSPLCPCGDRFRIEVVLVRKEIRP